MSEAKRSAQGGSPLFKLSATLLGHTGDVRGACGSDKEVPIPFIATASRDESAILWEYQGGSKYHQQAQLKGHTRYLMCVTCTAPTPEFPQGLVLTGSLDKTILVWNPAVPAGPIARLEGHTDAVCCLQAISPTTVVSSSWDSTARVWDLTTQQCTAVLKGHEASVLSVLPLVSSGEVVTASADRSLRRWRSSGEHVQTRAAAHADVIRGLCHVSEGVFASCSNDSTVVVWTATFDTIATFTGHQAFVYAVCSVPDSPLLASSGEDGCVKVWDMESGACVQTIDLPCTSVWSVAARWGWRHYCFVRRCKLPRVFTRAAAGPQVRTSSLQFEEHVAASFAARQAQQVGSLKKSDIPDKSVLETPGRREGEHKIVNNGGKIEAYTWSGQNWQYMGLVTDAVAPDYTFTVDLEGRNLKLEYNKGENPYEVAQKFIDKHELSQSFLDQIASFIIQNAQVPTLETGTPQPAVNPDPFTGGQSAVSGQHMQPPFSSSSAGYHNPDPYTGASTSMTTTTTTTTKPAAAAMFPNRTYVRFSQGKPQAALNKLKEFNATAASPLSASALSTLETVVADVHAYGDAAQLTATITALLSALESWDRAHHVPVLDLLRLALITPAAVAATASMDAALTQRIVTACGVYGEGPCMMLAMRVLTNLIAASPSAISPDQHSAVCESLLERNMAALKDAQILAVASYLLNLATWAVKQDAERDDVAQCQLQAVNAIHRVIVALPAHHETASRIISALGTLVSSSEVLLALALSLPNMSQCVNAFAGSSYPQQTRDMARHVYDLLK
ncbi:hypothetical protein PTSG_05652 [Salpingoeca rosetta]|uniref:Guanine nucleotide-binding protein subunit beta-like protein n=1 Tax=Salpingoeca rosetta (strain ATCC 50818 / BSB-021) TaxID=946362 RepID=F2UBU2_SALR5|nr:uncharacterized protein PTSG_05652 [Salpingoeca rosetta]EGD73958.1 hypothetical protein PTSG_05652 [Salpingoeca rosetta]|eukprot:XP_004993521.1 hypothetical protein PTSG_05652 [Salpingoeca rosetta]